MTQTNGGIGARRNQSDITWRLLRWKCDLHQAEINYSKMCSSFLIVMRIVKLLTNN
jgi:hypothetical protein